MSKIDYQVLREAAVAIETVATPQKLLAFRMKVTPQVVLAGGSAMKDHVHSGCGYPTGMFDYYYNQWLESDNKTPATDAFLAEARAHDLNAFIRHHSAELDAHIKNGGEQFDEKSVRIRDQ
ncbi:hypothetical protein [Escherichia coli]|uniref:hypothetical protein n=1 Tax=Escherichia coli TaxID=562 RepID=UPI000BB9798C|nr:hypothetical protein [Escherichia coli]